MKRTPNAEAIVGGIFFLGSAYGFSAVSAATSTVPADNKLWIPVAGPWMNLADRPSCGDSPRRPSCENESVNRALLVASGIAQGVGALEILGGLMFPKTELVTVQARGVRIVPSASATTVGVTAFGAF